MMESREKSQEKNIRDQQDDTEATTIVFTLTSRLLSWIVSGFLILSFLIFMAGYFLGQRKVLADFSCKIEQESLGDTIFSSLYTLHNTNKDSMDSSDDEGNSEIVEPVTEVTESQNVLEVPKIEEAAVVQKIENSSRYYADLIGFRTQAAAHDFAQRVQKDGVSVHVKKRMSKTAQGRQFAWYQVATDQFSEIAPLLELVKRIEKKEHLKANIQTCS